MQANHRRDTIEEILMDQEVQSQGQLAELLLAKGIETTQPMLSRDLRSLKVAKRDGIYQLFNTERVTPLENLASLLRSALVAGPNLCIVNCEPGAASAVARALEAEELSGILGTVAGDDCIFVAVESKVAGGQVVDLVEHTIGEEL
ncbi:MAG: transcriptional regulator of arginine metabolism [Candidatus Paceibacteria bacterium]|jgi:transcriptional regulator of arginine metabolism